MLFRDAGARLRKPGKDLAEVPVPGNRGNTASAMLLCGIAKFGVKFNCGGCAQSSIRKCINPYHPDDAMTCEGDDIAEAYQCAGTLCLDLVNAHTAIADKI